jgi:tetratricopeptide (TPR) repeat protein
VAYENLGSALAQQGRVDEAIVCYQKGLELEPHNAVVRNKLGMARVQQGRVKEATVHFEEALEIQPNDAATHTNFGNALVRLGEVDRAMAHHRKALEIQKKAVGEKHPDYATSLSNLAMMYLRAGDYTHAELAGRQAAEILEEVLGGKHPSYVTSLYNLVSVYRSMGDEIRAEPIIRLILEINPNDAQAHYLLGVNLHGRAKDQEVVKHWREALRLKPNQVVFLVQTAWVLATSPDASVRNGSEAITLASRAVQLSRGGTPKSLDALAAAYAEDQRFAEAAQTAERALEMASAEGDTAMATALRERLRMYRAGTAFRDSRPASKGKPAP